MEPPEPSRGGRGSGHSPCIHLATPVPEGHLWHDLDILGREKEKGGLLISWGCPLPFRQKAGVPAADPGVTSLLSTLLLASQEDFLSGWPTVGPTGILTSVLIPPL